MWFDQGELEPYEEGGAGDPSIVRARNKKDPVERMGDPINATAGAERLVKYLESLIYWRQFSLDSRPWNTCPCIASRESQSC